MSEMNPRLYIRERRGEDIILPVAMNGCGYEVPAGSPVAPSIL